jgi:hypothetical protein
MGLRWSRGCVLAFSTQVRGFKPGHTRVNMLTRVWQELEYRIDMCRVNRGAPI